MTEVRPACPRALAFFRAMTKAMTAERRLLATQIAGREKEEVDKRQEEFNRAVDDLYEKCGGIPHNPLHEFKGEC